MPKRHLLVVVSMILVMLFFTEAIAATYKCIDDNGDVTYSQTPCKQNQKTDKLLKGSKKPAEMEDCKYAGAFSQMTFRHMRSGLSTQQLFDRYGGVHSISRGTLGVINYVYSLKHSTTMQADRVAQLTIAKCKARAFGEVSCEDFPVEFQQTIFSCDDKARAEAIRLQKLIDQRVGQGGPFNNSATIDGYGSSDQETRYQERLNAQEDKRKQAERTRIAKCKKNYESQIRQIDDRMSRGYTASVGESLRDRRRSLVKKLATDCQ